MPLSGLAETSGVGYGGTITFILAGLMLGLGLLFLPLMSSLFVKLVFTGGIRKLSLIFPVFSAGALIIDELDFSRGSESFYIWSVLILLVAFLNMGYSPWSELNLLVAFLKTGCIIACY